MSDTVLITCALLVVGGVVGHTIEKHLEALSAQISGLEKKIENLEECLNNQLDDIRTDQLKTSKNLLDDF